MNEEEFSLRIKKIERELKLKEEEVGSLLELSKSINANLNVLELYDHYEHALSSNLKVRKLALFVEYEDWDCKVNFGSSHDFKGQRIHDKVLDFKADCQILKNVISPEYNDFQLITPIKHNNRILAYLLLGGMYDRAKSPTSIAIEMDIPFIRIFTNLIVVAIENKRMTAQAMKQEAVNRELEIAQRVQNHLFPEQLPNSEKLKIVAKYLPHQSVGGDYYDFQEFDGGFFLCVGDVSGKGVPAALLMSNFQAAFRILVRQTKNLSEMVQELNRLLYSNSKGELFVTFFLMKYDYESKNIEFINAGHNPGLLLYNNKVIELNEGTTVLGVFDPLPFLNHGTIKADSFKLVLFSDGVSEAENDQNEYFGEAGIKKELLKHWDKSAEVISNGIIEELDDFMNGLTYNDDLTLFVCEKL